MTLTTTPQTTEIRLYCPNCGKLETLTVDSDLYEQWENNTISIEAFAELDFNTKARLEWLKSHFENEDSLHNYCNDCIEHLETQFK